MSGDLTGRRLGNYRIDGVLGKGGMSVMYRATDVRLGRKVALKVIGDHLGADAEFRERFVDEARNTSAIDHANVVPVYDFGELDGMLYIAMRLVDGADLASLIGGSPMERERALALLDQVADALDSLHERGLVHLDVKPANVLVTSRESSREHVYVADFGLTRRGATGHRTRGGDFLGSPTYAAPEHLRGEPLDGRTDQYALACVVYACLTGSPPYKGDVPTVIKGHLGADPPSVARVVNLPAGIDDVIRKGMAKNPNDRYPSCVELIAAARRALVTTGESAVVGAAGAQGTGHQAHPGGPHQNNGQQGPPHQGQGDMMHGQQPPPGPHQGGPPQGPPPGYGQGRPGGQQPWTGGPQQGPPPGQSPQGPPPGYGQQPGPGYGRPSGPGTPPQGLGAPPQGGMQGGMQGPPPGYGRQPEPVRLRPPAPAGSSAFAQNGPGKSNGKRWIAPLIVGILLIAAIVTTIVLVTGEDSEEPSSPTGTNAPAPEIPVDPGGSATREPGESSSRKPIPTSIPIQPPAG
ncbi:serine/threonine protein kinase [Amycolatopsis antarctica]|uniref:non-specific serine/threonine protein kinase n=1 Tax=Amycolatopsis antarctica TaxID=1854586 RepID=A0A263CXY6_9PSEU|nr:serine/threonine protein kinase [Amycolatopsis antarctica]